MSIEANIARLQNIIAVNTKIISEKNTQINALNDSIDMIESGITPDLSDSELDILMDDIQSKNEEIVNLQREIGDL